MSRKQEIYSEILFWALPYIRNAQSNGWWRRARDRSCFNEAQFIHSLPNLILEPEFGDGDLWFLNHHARHYFEEADAGRCPNAVAHRPLVAELHALVPEKLRPALAWAGPESAA